MAAIIVCEHDSTYAGTSTTAVMMVYATSCFSTFPDPPALKICEPEPEKVVEYGMPRKRYLDKSKYLHFTARKWLPRNQMSRAQAGRQKRRMYMQKPIKEVL